MIFCRTMTAEKCTEKVENFLSKLWWFKLLFIDEVEVSIHPSRSARLAVKHSQLWLKSRAVCKEGMKVLISEQKGWQIGGWRSVLSYHSWNASALGKGVSMELIPKGLQHLILEHHLKMRKKWKLSESLFVEICWNMKQFSLQAQHLGVQ